jgi:hypothetical protein
MKAADITPGVEYAIVRGRGWRGVERGTVRGLIKARSRVSGYRSNLTSFPLPDGSTYKSALLYEPLTGGTTYAVVDLDGKTVALPLGQVSKPWADYEAESAEAERKRIEYQAKRAEAMAPRRAAYAATVERIAALGIDTSALPEGGIDSPANVLTPEILDALLTIAERPNGYEYRNTSGEGVPFLTTNSLEIALNWLDESGGAVTITREDTA